MLMSLPMAPPLKMGRNVSHREVAHLQRHHVLPYGKYGMHEVASVVALACAIIKYRELQTATWLFRPYIGTHQCSVLMP